MEKLTAAIRLTLVVLLGSAGVSCGENIQSDAENTQNDCPEGTIEDMSTEKCVVPSSQAEGQDLTSWQESQKHFSEGYVADADFFLTRFFTEEIHDFSALVDLFEELDKRKYEPLHFIDGDYSESFLDNFFIGSWFQWRTDVLNKAHLVLMTESATDKNEELYADVWGRPELSKWSIIGKDDVHTAYVLGFKNARIIHGRHDMDAQGVHCEDIDVDGPIVKVFTPVFEDINDDGKSELLLRYNLAVADGYIQYLKIYRSSFREDTCSTRLVKDFSARNGFIFYSDEVFTVGTQTALDNESWLSASQHVMEDISYDGETEKTLGKKTVKNVLHGDDSRFWK